MAAAHKGAISFGLVHIPVQLYKTTRDTDISFHQLCKQTLERVSYRKYCGNCDTELKSSDIIKGYEYDKDKYVTMTSEEIDALKADKDRTIIILQFAELEEINDLYYEKNYYAIPEPYAEKAYELLRKAMLDKGVVGIAKTVISTKETLIVLCPTKDGILVKTLFYEDEIAENPKAFKKPKINKSEADIAKQLIQTMTKAFDSSAYKDEFKERLKAAIEDKINGQKTIEVKKNDASYTNPIDLMKALQLSLTQTKSKGSRKRVKH